MQTSHVDTDHDESLSPKNKLCKQLAKADNSDSVVMKENSDLKNKSEKDCSKACVR